MIALYNPRSSAGRKPIVPYALLALAAVLEEADLGPWALVDGNLEDPVPELDRLIRMADEAPILGVTVMPGPQLEEAVLVCRALRRLHPGLVIVWGGYFPTQHTETVLKAGWESGGGPGLVDYVVKKHGERAFVALVQALRFGGSTVIAGVCSREGESAPDPTPHPRDLPVFPFEQVDLSRYVRPTFLGARTLGYHSSYGCPFTCSFCAVVNMVEGRWYPQTPEQVCGRVDHLVARYGIDAVEFYDNNFFTKESRTVAIADRLRDHGLSWWGEARVDTLLRYSDESLRRCAESGLRMVFLGAESGSAETLARMNKGGTLVPEMTLALVERLRGFGIVPELSFVLGNPPDPEADIAQTLAFVREVKARNPQTEIILYLYTPVPLDGELLDAARDAGFRYPDTLEEWVDGAWLETAQRRSELPWVSRRLRRRLRGFERVLNAYYPTSTDQRMGPRTRRLLRMLSRWRYEREIYAFPVELQVLQRLIRYQRPETSGF